jgi:hypothetical protein
LPPGLSNNRCSSSAAECWCNLSGSASEVAVFVALGSAVSQVELLPSCRLEPACGFPHSQVGSSPLYDGEPKDRPRRKIFPPVTQARHAALLTLMCDLGMLACRRWPTRCRAFLDSGPHLTALSVSLIDLPFNTRFEAPDGGESMIRRREQTRAFASSVGWTTGSISEMLGSQL